MLGKMSLFTSLIILILSGEVIAVYQSPPFIVKQPPTDELLFQVHNPSENVNEKPFVIECEAEGEPAPKYRWIKNGKHFDWQAYDDRISQQPGRGTLVISSPRDEDGGQYQCFATNDWGTATSNSVFVRKAELNSFKDVSRVDVYAHEGDPFRLSCHPPDGWPKPRVYWLLQGDDGSIKSINNSRMAVDPEGNLWFTNVTRFDASEEFSYVCAVSSVFRNEYKLGNKIKLNVILSGASAAQNKHEPIIQYVSRKNEAALRGSKLELFCIFGGTPLPQIVWSKNGHTIDSSERVTQSNFGKSLIINDVQFADQGSYTCEASNGVGVAKSYSILLKVLAVPYFTVEPEIISAAEDEVAELHCAASGIPEPEIKWIHNGLPISEAPLNPRRIVTPNFIRIERLTKKDIGNYGCNATNSLGYVYKDVFINVLALKPDITEAPEDKEVVDGKTTKLTCRVFGSPKPEVKWIREGVVLTGGRYTVLSEGDLEIREVNFLDRGNYTCHASNKLGSVSSSASLIVRQHTRIIDEPEDYEVDAGNAATFRCNAVADSSLQLAIDWINNGQVIDFESEPRFIKTNDYSLTITKTTELDSGTYTCVASTPLDEVTAQATLTVQDVPNAPEVLGVECNNLDATIRWKSLGDNRAPILRYSIDYNTSFTPNSWDKANDNVPATDTTYTFHMSPWANYTFRVSAWNKVGPSPPSSHSDVCTTLPDVPYKNPDNVEGKGTQPDNMVISWTPMPEIEHNAPRFQYRVFWKPEKYGSWVSNDIDDPKVSQLVIPDLNTFEKFVIKVIAINEKGEANVSPKEVIGYSGEDVPTDAPTNLTVLEIISATSALFSWNPVSPASVRGHFKGYKIQTWAENDENNSKEIRVSGNIMRVSINKLTPYSKNYARVLVYNSLFNGPPSESITFETPEGVPGTVRFLDAYPLGSSAFILTWKPPEFPNGNLTGYKIYYQTVKGTSIGPLIERKPQINDPKQLRAKLAGLEPGTKYRIHIKATTAAGEGEGYFIERSARNSFSAIPNKSNFKLVQLPSDNGFSNVKVIRIPTEGNFGSHFYVEYRIKGAPIYEKTSEAMNEDFIIVRGLQPSETYEFKVVTVDGYLIAVSDVQEIEMPSYDGTIIQPMKYVDSVAWLFWMILPISLYIFAITLLSYILSNIKYAARRRQATGHHEYRLTDADFDQHNSC